MPLSRFLSTTSTGSPRAWDVGYLFYDPPQSERFDIDNSVPSFEFSTSGQETSPMCVSFKPDGSKMYISGTTGDDVNEYDLSPNWDTTSASFVHSFSTIAQDSFVADLVFKPDGTQMYTLGVTGDAVYEYDLSTAWDVSTASFVQNYPVGTQETSPRGLFIKPDGTKMYVTGTAGDDVNEYDLSTAWDISTASYVQSASVNDTSPTGLEFSQDGEKMYVTGDGSNNIHEFTLSTAWDVSTATLSGTSFTISDTSPSGLYLVPDGSAIYYVGRSGDTVNRVSMGSFSVASEETSPNGISFKPDGTKMFITGYSGDDINEYDLSTAWDTSTATFSQNFSLSAQDTLIRGHYFKADGTRLFVVGGSSDKVYEYNLSTAWDVSSITYDQDFSVAGQEATPVGVHFSPDGTKMYVIGQTGDDVNEYTLTTAWELSTASFVQSFSISAQDTTPMAVVFRPDGKRMFVCGNGSDAVNQYDLTVAWDVSTASFSKKATLDDSYPAGIFFRDDGLKLFSVDLSQRVVFTYTLGQQP